MAEAAVASTVVAGAVASTGAAVFQEAGFEAAAASEEAAFEAVAVLAEPIEARPRLRAAVPIRAAVRTPVRREDQALPTVVPHTAVRVRMAPLAAAAPPAARGRGLTLPARAPALRMRTLTANGIPLAALAPACAAMLRPQRLAASAIRRWPPGATAIPPNLPAWPPPGQARRASQAPLAELLDSALAALTGDARALTTSAPTAIASASAASASTISAGTASASAATAGSASTISASAGWALVLDSAARGDGAVGDSAGVGAVGILSSALVSGDGLLMDMDMGTTRFGIGTVSTIPQASITALPLIRPRSLLTISLRPISSSPISPPTAKPTMSCRFMLLRRQAPRHHPRQPIRPRTLPILEVLRLRRRPTPRIAQPRPNCFTSRRAMFTRSPTAGSPMASCITC